MKSPIEPGYSLRAEIRRIRPEQRNMLQRAGDLIRVLRFDGEILTRLASLGASLHAHKQLEILNGQHCHHLGKADQSTSIAPEGQHADKARHSGFSVDPVTVPVLEHETPADVRLPILPVLNECVEARYTEEVSQHVDVPAPHFTKEHFEVEKFVPRERAFENRFSPQILDEMKWQISSHLNVRLRTGMMCLYHRMPLTHQLL